MNEINDQTGKGGERNLCTHGEAANPRETPALAHTPQLLWPGRSSLHRGIQAHRRRTCGKTGEEQCQRP